MVDLRQDDVDHGLHAREALGFRCLELSRRDRIETAAHDFGDDGGLEEDQGEGTLEQETGLDAGESQHFLLEEARDRQEHEADEDPEQERGVSEHLDVDGRQDAEDAIILLRAVVPRDGEQVAEHDTDQHRNGGDHDGKGHTA